MVDSYLIFVLLNFETLYGAYNFKAILPLPNRSIYNNLN